MCVKFNDLTSMNPSDGIKSVLGSEGLDLSPECTKTYEDLFWKALREGMFDVGEALGEVFCQLSIARSDQEHLSQLFTRAAYGRAKWRTPHGR